VASARAAWIPFKGGIGRGAIATGSLCLGWLAFTACSSSEEAGLEVTVTMAAAPHPAPNGTLEIQTDLGYSVTLRRALVSVAAVEIVDCGKTAEIVLENLGQGLSAALQ
jgi:hypothetical protein